ncbi:MAG TPA: LLM class flavin-dependent oxidoreductase, partial [Leptolinea sp.]
MQYGFVLPFGDANFAAECAALAESSGWDGFFVCEPVWGVDAWISLTAAAMVTKSIRLGTMLSPLPVLTPWKLAGETASLDNLSGGRVILSVGLGAVDTGFANFNLPTDRNFRAELLDEGLGVLTGLWKGQPFRYEGKHFHLEPTNFNPPPSPLQKPRIPIWVVGAWPKMKSMRRAMQYDGLLPNFLGEDSKVEFGKPKLAAIKEMTNFVKTEIDPERPYEIIMEGETDPSRPAS